MGELHRQARFHRSPDSRGIPESSRSANPRRRSYIAGGAFAVLARKEEFENSGSWLKGPGRPGTSQDGKLKAIQLPDGSRVVITARDLWAKAGITAADDDP